MLHIHNGDSAANTAKQTSLPGEHVAFRESLITGPTSSEVGTDWRALRARHLSSAYGVDQNKCAQDLKAQEEKLTTFREHDEVVFWFEHDLFCQVHLIYLLDWFGKQQAGATRLSLICIAAFPGRENFRGLGELAPDEMASLFRGRQPVIQSQLALASAAWRAYCSADPTEVQNLLTTDTSSLPFLKAALNAHLRRFPSTTNGLGLIENTLLQLIENGVTGFSQLFWQFVKTEPVYGFGDTQVWLALRQLNLGAHPLLAVKNGNQLGESIVPNADLEITDTGKSVLRGDADHVSLNGVELWLGGVHLSGCKQVWRWDDQNQRVLMG